ncbi:class I SAM-dependent methyltransferase [Vibrio sp. TH_r3]|uniref:class I SAM-dependent methyltransferase n=1 Tax=Vibrio sp. TH_r3 TaxID=3082084 RepID=UPI002953AAE5|nr:class I SAM-dependent methyltransferase [Vibrio sp. TH_r3]MDV7106039.1 class I SAM-dependent methyltransferase [Vibrio sp. TH_r3]
MNKQTFKPLTKSSNEAQQRLNYAVPAHLLQPMWLRGQESLVDDGLIYDPIAANACRNCILSDECLAGDINQKQLLHATITKICDERVQMFLEKNPNAWVLNIGAGLDTRFYRLDNGICHWIEIDVSENLLWREKLFHSSGRYKLICGSVDDVDWIDSLSIPSNVPVLIVCENALLSSSEHNVRQFIQSISLRFNSCHACIVVAGDKSSSTLGLRLGSQQYLHGLAKPAEKLRQWLPWCKSIKLFSPLDDNCGRWKLWQRALSVFPSIRNRLTPVLVELSW